MCKCGLSINLIHTSIDRNPRSYRMLNTFFNNLRPVKQFNYYHFKSIAIGVTLIALTGCAGGPIGFGGTHDISYKDRDKITITYDSLLESYDDVYDIAKHHCQSFNRGVRISNLIKDPATLGLIKTYTVSCTGTISNVLANRASTPKPAKTKINYTGNSTSRPKSNPTSTIGEDSSQVEALARQYECSGFGHLLSESRYLSHYEVICDDRRMQFKCEFHQCKLESQHSDTIRSKGNNGVK